MDDAMRYHKSIRVSYSVKNDDGFIVERRHKFPTMNDAIIFLHLLKQDRLVGKPVLETK